jgi:hypothetical protein
MFPFVARELGADFSLDAVLRFGSLPGIYSEQRYRVDKLRAYVHTYLRQEIQQEALVKDLGSFHRFLKVAAIMHGQVVNQAAISRDAAVARSIASHPPSGRLRSRRSSARRRRRRSWPVPPAGWAGRGGGVHDAGSWL